MNYSETTPLEKGVLEIWYQAFKNLGFPNPNDVRVVNRDNTGGGRFVYLYSDAVIKMPDSGIDLFGSYIAMEGLPDGLMAVLSVENQKLDMIEFAVYGETPWDGVERKWEIK